tara:strand:- start:765 stop:2162 length:1398 start_codon:yes stop_codon:yes gene_type:complete
MSFNKPGANNGNVAAGFGNFLGPTVNTDSYGLLHSFNMIGGFTEMPSIADRDAIPVYDNGIGTHTGFTAGVDGYSTGRRRIGMLVYVMETKKIYQLLPKGYFGNQGDATFADFNNLTEWERARLLHPTATNIFNDVFIPPPQGGPAYEAVQITGTADDCWVELQLGGDNIYTSNLTPTLEMTEDVGGMPSGTLVSDLSNIKTYDELFDTILFPTSYPTASGPSVGLSLSPVVPQGLKVVGEVYAGNLVTTANQGSITLNGVNQGVRSGDVTAANITGPGGPYTLGVTAPNGIDDQAITHTVTLGSNSWTLTATFAIGPVPQDSTGAPYTAVQFNGGDKDNPTSFEGVYPYFLGTDAGEDQFTERALISFSSNNVQCLQDYPEDSGATGNPVLNHRILVPLARSAGAITIQVFNPNGSGAAAWPDNTAFWTEGANVQRTVAGQQVDYRVFTKDGSSGGSNNYRLVF